PRPHQAPHRPALGSRRRAPLRRLRGAPGRELFGGAGRRSAALVLLGELRRSARALGRSRALREPLRSDGRRLAQPTPAWARAGPRLAAAGVRFRPLQPQLDPDEVRALRTNYAGNVTLIDDQIGNILETLRKRGEL